MAQPLKNNDNDAWAPQVDRATIVDPHDPSADGAESLLRALATGHSNHDGKDKDEATGNEEALWKEQPLVAPGAMSILPMEKGDPNANAIDVDDPLAEATSNPYGPTRTNLDARATTLVSSTGDTAAIPPPPSFHVGSRIQQESRPGAYHGAPGQDPRRLPPGQHANSLLVHVLQEPPQQQQIEERGPQPTSSNNSNSRLAQAHLVEEGSVPVHHLPQAQQWRDRDHTKQLKHTLCLMGLAIVVVASVIVLVVLVVVATNNMPDAAGTSIPGPAASPATGQHQQLQQIKEQSFLSLLPNATQQAIISIVNDDDDDFDNADRAALPAAARAFQWLVHDPAFQTDYYSNDRLLQRYALATFYYATNGDTSWFQTTNWLSYDHHECSWFAKLQWDDGTLDLVHYDQQEVLDDLDGTNDGYSYESYEKRDAPTGPCVPWRVQQGEDPGPDAFQHLYLRQSGLQGTIPEELYLLTGLRSISLGGNPELSGTISTRIGLLTKLEGFMESGSPLSGTIPSEIGLATNLYMIILSNSNLEGTLPSELFGLSHLNYLWVEQNQLSGSLPTAVGLMTDLRQIYVHFNQITGTMPTQLGLLSNSIEFIFSDNQITGPIPSEFGMLGALENIVIVRNELSGHIPSELGMLSSILGIDFAFSSLTGSVPSQLGLLTTNIYLMVEENELTGTLPTEIGQQSLLEWFLFNGNHLQGQLPSQLGLMTNLQWFSAANNDFGGELPMFESPSMEYFNISGNAFEGEVPQDLCILDLYDTLGFDCTATLCGCWCSCNATGNATFTTALVRHNSTDA